MSQSDWSRKKEESRFDGLRRSWSEVESAESREWTARIEKVHSEYTRMRQEGRWVGGPTDFLGVLGRSRHEVTHSKLLAWLLDPGMRHGLGPIVLKKLMRRCFPEQSTQNLELARVRTEVYRFGGRVDIVVEGVDFTLVIENKVDAKEGEDQCHSYFKAFQDSINPLFLFLTPDGRAPESVSGESKEAYRSIAYGEILEDLNDALRGNKSKVASRRVAEDYRSTLERVFGTHS